VTILTLEVAVALNIKNPEVERLVAEVAELANETKTEAVRRALLERRERLGLHVVKRDRDAELLEFLEREVWPQIPPEVLGTETTKEEEEELLGFGEDGV